MTTVTESTPHSAPSQPPKRGRPRRRSGPAVMLAALGCVACGPVLETPADDGLDPTTDSASGDGSTSAPGSTTGTPGTTATPPPPPTTAPPPPPPTTASPTATSGDSSGTDVGGDQPVDCEESEDRLFLTFEPLDDWGPEPLSLDTTCVVEDDYHGGQTVRYVLHCDAEEAPELFRVTLRWVGSIRRPLADGETVRLRAAFGESEDNTAYVAAAIHSSSGDLRAGVHDWPLPAWLDADPLQWLDLDVVVLSDACEGAEPEGGGGFIPDRCGAQETPLALLLLGGDAEATIPDQNLGALGDLAVDVHAKHRDWWKEPCGQDDTYSLAISGPDL